MKIRVDIWFGFFFRIILEEGFFVDHLGFSFDCNQPREGRSVSHQNNYNTRNDEILTDIFVEYLRRIQRLNVGAFYKTPRRKQDQSTESVLRQLNTQEERKKRTIVLHRVNPPAFQQSNQPFPNEPPLCILLHNLQQPFHPLILPL